MDKSFLKMISLSTLICCFGNISVAKAIPCANIKDKHECNVAHMKQSPWKVEGSPCRWIDSSSKEFNQLEKAWGQNLAGINCFSENILKLRSCTYQSKEHLGDLNIEQISRKCERTPGCQWIGNKCVVSSSEEKTIPSSKTPSSTKSSENSSSVKMPECKGLTETKCTSMGNKCVWVPSPENMYGSGSCRINCKLIPRNKCDETNGDCKKGLIMGCNSTYTMPKKGFSSGS